jgi:NADH-quinone oxidoreductase subunit G
MYETKQTSTADNSPKIYRVKNDFHFVSLCGAGRFGYDFENSKAKKDEVAFNSAIKALKEADTIKFSSYITNEEALILQKLKEKFGYKLINSDAYNFKEFMDSFKKSAGEFYNATLKDIKNSDYIICIGSRITTDSPAVRYAITSAFKKNRAEIVYMHPLEDDLLTNAITQFVKYEVGSEEGVLALLLKYLIDNSLVQGSLKEYIEELDEGYISAESNVGEEEFELIRKKLNRKNKFSLIIGEDVINHSRANNIAKLSGLIQRYSKFKVLITPPKTNTLGVSLICDLDKEEGNKTVGYNENGEFVLSSLGAKNDNELDMPALNQQEGTITNIDKRVVVINPALPYNGYTLLEVANKLGLNGYSYTVDYTKELPINRGYKSVDFDSLDNHYTRDGVEKRGYLLEIEATTPTDEVEEIEEIKEFNGSVVYRCNPILHFNEFTAKSTTLKTDSVLTASKQFAIASKIEDKDLVEIDINGVKIQKVFKIDTSLKGTIALLDTFDDSISNYCISSDYRFAITKITKVENS